ncbi:DUF697 domain-containing protein [Prochlorococcus sp. AH-736-A13]|nr:DUF697 domain-containing protein [Prochlorococcus sp. AH-736-A13]
MNYLKLKYIKYVVLILFLYILFSIFVRIVNIYTLLFLIIIIYTFYNIDKKLFKKIVYKVIYKNKKNTLSFKNTYGAAKISLEGVEKINKKISDKVKAELLNYQKSKLESQLKTGDYKVTLFGAGSSGKTSIARSLLKNIVGQTSAKIGTTKQINSYKIRIPILKRNINIVDTPGLFEPSKLGEEREKATILQASNSDLVLFVLDQDINKYENYLIKELLKLRKKIIIVLNKCDLRSRDENNLIKKNIISITSSRKNKISVVQTIAVPQKSPYTKSDALNLVPEVGSLFREIIETLDNNGEELLADNILFRSNKLGIKSKNFVQEQRYLMSNKVINKYMWITGGVILVNPLPAVDFLTTTSVNLQMIMELSKIYEIKLTKKDAKDLATSLLSALAKQGILKGGLAILSPALATSLTKIILSKSIQSVTAGWLIRIVGLSLIEYFKNGQDWGDGGIQEVVDKIYRISKREEILNNFVKEAISKIEMKKYFKSNKSLPLVSRIQKVVTMEEGTLIGGFGSAIVELLNDNEVNIPVYRIGIPDVLVDHASPDQSKEKLGLKPDQMADKIVKKFKLNN